MTGRDPNKSEFTVEEGRMITAILGAMDLVVTRLGRRIRELRMLSCTFRELQCGGLRLMLRGFGEGANVRWRYVVLMQCGKYQDVKKWD